MYIYIYICIIDAHTRTHKQKELNFAQFMHLNYVVCCYTKGSSLKGKYVERVGGGAGPDRGDYVCVCVRVCVL